jgi:hypothetical protein
MIVMGALRSERGDSEHRLNREGRRSLVLSRYAFHCAAQHIAERRDRIRPRLAGLRLMSL